VPNAVESPDELSDEKLMVRVTHAINTKHGYGFLKEAWEKGRVQRGGWKALFLFPIRYHVQHKDGKKRWQMQVSPMPAAAPEIMMANQSRHGERT
jgi:hypothetical protein